jgi:alpha-D-ribose 1-methylphosphonate 5-triphosphate diphosphatase PhnM
MATVNPARAAGIPGRMNGLVPGDRADFVLFRHESGAERLEILETWLAGRKVYP